ncbi:hypothetical protein GZH47_30480 [Paenibacillus rhizovicinus]|uniref:Luciferase domain-containing protein n=1 Tax=Paenibacillus rhizovicinus TaxID=2704463 RepID=A0A6C0P825_9BACL|nr:luciferase family protein [Paenibacillus rhizovicinus]QHW34698.1 hypothetical protein GZH47_30480 [Paenibacillus rhizovicinus]
MTLSIKQAIETEVLSWPEVSQQPHRFGGTEYLYREQEIGHLHGEQLLDVLFPKTLRDDLVNMGNARPHHIYPDSGWVSYYLRTCEDAAGAIALLRLKYDRMTAKPD